MDLRDNKALAGASAAVESCATRTEAVIAAHEGNRRKKRPVTDPGPFRSRSLAPIAWIVGAVFAGIALLVYLFAPGDRPPSSGTLPCRYGPLAPIIPPSIRLADAVDARRREPPDPAAGNNAIAGAATLTVANIEDADLAVSKSGPAVVSAGGVGPSRATS